MRPEEHVVEKLRLESNFNGGAGDGPVQATFPKTILPVHSAWLEAFRDLGLESSRDPLTGRALGGAITSNHIDAVSRERCHAAVAYLTPEVRARANPMVVAGAFVKRVEFGEKADQSDLAVARSVLYEKDGRSREIKVGREVILAAGAFGSPQLLELSGIGNGQLLSKHAIDVVYDNPAVGENLQDHIRAGISHEPAEAADSQPRISNEEAEKLYDENRTGPWAEMPAYMFAYMPLVPFSSKAEMQELATICQQQRQRDDDGGKLSPFERKQRDFVTDTLFSPGQSQRDRLPHPSSPCALHPTRTRERPVHHLLRHALPPSVARKRAHHLSRPQSQAGRDIQLLHPPSRP